jgi:galactokinase/mevalonate kinase-like predicted kinase
MTTSTTSNSTGQKLIETIVSEDDSLRHRSLSSFCESRPLEELLEITKELDSFWRSAPSLYHRVRAMFFLSAIYRYELPTRLSPTSVGLIPHVAHEHLLSRRFVEAIDELLEIQAVAGPSPAVASGLAKAYYQLAFQTLADQVRRSVRTVRGNQWMFRVGHPDDHPLRIRKELLQQDKESGVYPILSEKTSVRMDFSHSGWSDIFFLGMDFPEGAQVINASIDLAVYKRDPVPKPPVEAYVRVIDRPVLRLVSVDLQSVTEIEAIDDVFDFAKDYLGLLKAALIASGIVPPAMEGCHLSIRQLLNTLLGKDGLGLEVVSQVNDIPKGSRLAVSTNLLGCLIAALMRATGQVASLEEGLQESERRLVAARAILGEWLGGSGGGWQDSGGVWPGIKWIHGSTAVEGDPEYGVSRGRLLPKHVLLDEKCKTSDTYRKLQESLVLVHGGMAQNVGPILEMVTEKYLLRNSREWKARDKAIEILGKIRTALEAGDLRSLGRLTTENFQGPLQQIIPACTNQFTDSLIEQAKAKFGEQFWGFWMLGGMAGGGMGFIFDPSIKPLAKDWLLETMRATKQRMQASLAFAMDPVVYDFAINDRGSWAKLLVGNETGMPQGYYALLAPGWIKQEIRSLSDQTQKELVRLGQRCRTGNENSRWLIERLLPQLQSSRDNEGSSLRDLLKANGFDRQQHEQIRTDLLSGRIGLSQNRLPRQTSVEDVEPGDVVDLRNIKDSAALAAGQDALARGEVAVVTLAAGAGTRWTGGAGVVKALNPFCKLGGEHRSFLEIHLAKSAHTAERFQHEIPHFVTTSYLTEKPIAAFIQGEQERFKGVRAIVSPGKSIGLRMIPMQRDLRFLWEESAQQVLDQQKQKVRDSLHNALLGWAASAGEASDYVDNIPQQCLHPIGHWYEVPNLLRNGVLADLLVHQPQLRHLMLHNIDTLGASLDPQILGTHIQSGSCLGFEVIPRRIEDRGGGLAKVDGRLRLLEGLAMPREEDEFRLSYYNSMTTWIDIDRLLAVFGLDRTKLQDNEKVDAAIRKLAHRLPTYITIKDVKKRWGHGQEDVYPVSQFEKLWGDMTYLSDVDCQFFVVSTIRGQQLKELAQLDGWLRDGSADSVQSLCKWR